MKNQRCIFDRALRVTGFVKSDFGSPEILVQPLGWSCISICRESKTRLLILETGTRSFSSVNKPKAPSLLAMARDAIKGYVCGEIPLLPSITPSPCPYSIPFLSVAELSFNNNWFRATFNLAPTFRKIVTNVVLLFERIFHQPFSPLDSFTK